MPILVTHFSWLTVLLVGTACIYLDLCQPAMRPNAYILALFSGVESLITRPEVITSHILKFLQGQGSVYLSLEIMTNAQGIVTGTSGKWHEEGRKEHSENLQWPLSLSKSICILEKWRGHLKAEKMGVTLWKIHPAPRLNSLPLCI